jgi:serine phosphatase RsbU (regulator of sigma subunit)
MLSSIFRSPRWNEIVVPIATGQNILLYTDGVSEAFLIENGEERIKAAIERHADGGAPLLDAIVADVDRHRGHHPYRDDVTLVTAKILPT